jgi:transposase
MISWEVYMDIVAFHRQGLTERSIARKLNIHRNTFKKYLQEGQKPRHQKTKCRESILSLYYQVIDDFLKEDDYRATWIYDRIKQLGYTGGYDTVKNHVRKVKQQQQRQAYIRFETVPGLQGQMDWADFQVADLLGGIFTVYLFILVLGFSRPMYAELVERFTLQSFMDAHIRAFHYLGLVQGYSFKRKFWISYPEKNLGISPADNVWGRSAPTNALFQSQHSKTDFRLSLFSARRN